MRPVLQFLGAAGTVTGSRFLLQTPRSSVLIDVGLFQGLKRHRVHNWEPFPVEPSSIDAVALTHAHVDHSGYLPALVHQGFEGRVTCTRRTAQLCEILLPDAAHLQEEEARYANRKGFSKHQPARPLFTTADAHDALALIDAVPFSTAQHLTADVSATFHPAGHILGSSSVLLEIDTGPRPTRVLVSGDLGRNEHPLLSRPHAPPAADVVLLESTYGDRLHPDPGPEIDELAEAITETAAAGGMILIPAFAVDRTEVVLLLLRDLMSTGRIPTLPVFADSPMALSVLEVYRRAIRHGDDDVAAAAHPTPFDPGGGLHECRTPQESKSLNELTYPSIIVSASGMATGGRVLHHLTRLLPDPRNTVVLTGFQAAGTRGRTLAEGAEHVKMLGRYIPARARVVQTESLSVHADAAELTDWVKAMPEPPKIVYVVHGDRSASEALATRLRHDIDIPAVLPHPLERVLLN